MKEEKKEAEVVNPIDMLFDPDNKDNIVLYNEKDEPVEFEQIALIPLNDRVYAILTPAKKVEGIADDEAFAFEIIEDEENGDSLALVEDDVVIDSVFEEYNKLYEQKDE